MMETTSMVESTSVVESISNPISWLGACKGAVVFEVTTGFSESLHQAESVKRQALHVYLCALCV